jgi:ATP-dependent DNA helicase DinG
MPVSAAETRTDRIVLPDIPALTVSAAQAVMLTSEGEVRILPHAQAQMLIHGRPVMVCHAPYTARRLGVEDLKAFDLLELFAFVHPAKFCVPTPAGLAKALGMPPPQTLEDMPLTLVEAAQNLLSDLRGMAVSDKKGNPLEIAKVMGLQGRGWVWAPFICAALGEEYDPAAQIIAKSALNVWKHMPEWSETAPVPPPAHHAVTGKESRQRLKKILSDGDSEARAEQVHYATEITTAFNPIENREQPHLVLAEAGTGVGKTLGYLAPASVWAEKNDGTVWVSTYTRNLQRQIDQELTRLYPDGEAKARNVAVRKGRENYLCLLNLEDEAAGAALSVDIGQVIGAGLMARWAEASRDGDLTGGDFPGWLPGLIGWKHSLGLADRRGECIFSACDHYHRCFVEKAARKAKHADIVVANHALVMIQTALSGSTDELPKRYVFDEGHHLFDAADSAFAGHLTAKEGAELRRWIKGAEGGRKSRARGLKRKVEDLLVNDAEGMAELEAILYEANCLPSAGWSKRLKEQQPKGAAEDFLLHVYRQVYLRAEGRDGPYSLETDTQPLIPGLAESAGALKHKLKQLQKPMRSLCARLRRKLVDQADTLDGDTRRRFESVSTMLERRGDLHIGAWIGMLETLQMQGTPPEYVDWMQIERIDGQAADVGLYRHWVDPMKPFAQAIRPHAHGIAITSATLRDATGDDGADWEVACERTGTEFLSNDVKTFSVKSPFDYPAQTKVFIVNDVRKDDLAQVAAAYRVLFEASGGGALGLFTSISRLRGVYDRIAERMELMGLPLYAQHVDDMDTGTLVDMFREDIHASLLGTDAVRDGVDVPGESLRLLVYDRVPWPRPTILHRARKNAFGGKIYDERIARLKLRQAFGRLVRRANDRGVFVMLDPMLPGRLQTAFPEGVDVVKAGLAEVAESIRVVLKGSV